MLNDEEMTEARSKALLYVDAFVKGYDPIKRSLYLEQGQKKDSMLLVLSMINLAARDLLVVKYASEDTELMIYGSAEDAVRASEKANGRSIVKLFDITSELLRSANKNVNASCASSAVNTLI